MSRKLSNLSAVCVAIAISCSSQALVGQEWATKMFADSRHDFGAVAKGSQAVVDFEFENIYEEDVHVIGVRTSCRCVTAEVIQPTLKTWEKGVIRATLNTDAFVGQRSATVTVMIDQPFRAEVQLGVTGYIRQDVELNPRLVQFGNVDQGTAYQASLDVLHVGAANWQVVDVQSENPHLNVSIVERQRNRGRVVYRLDVTLKEETPCGAMFDEIKLVTNDQQHREINVPVEANVVSALTASPALISFGALSPGDVETKRVVIRGREPFLIEDIRSDDDRLQASIEDEQAPIQIIPISFAPDDNSAQGEVSGSIHIFTTCGSLTIPYHAVIAESSSDGQD